ncbi:bifunctional 4-hydroxy-2-oxoglutarate aldolase/2-dehydro-3-deoxy-phosphogluconate aldolase [Maribacter litopenaei]|uniref:Bifunctional 4-hydroxy-2-oxoglutarate aldolase/2-dehydro-3-deoxy-phosphogluconate aldolase n=1 Tax=Maribacter litopenaei TaxID=2976127 RepID=A0ABY5YB02_9FLAO|nr:bifunctional 4-hydroxy-2-oxoglutarate aldolase/2-dehydro-3-deoxy-phosphogluconate aldolase [Maribacter litopenaei]UWX56233.1 bifunctional 4-hydroxy-2-oxoglutarate aldolase/2-dehydro-3-deoxy-phosphogluconate aldolase [Maribacter litopenaei]
MKKEEVIRRIKREKIIAIVRLDSQGQVSPLIKILVENGISILEITSNTPGFTEEISKAKKSYPRTIIGAGTVLNPKIAEAAIKAGAQFLVTPNVNPGVIKIAKQHAIPVLMGAMTPTEIYNAIETGADFIKLFPAGNLGVVYFKALKSVFNQIDFFAVGGIDTSNIQEWLTSGVAGIGLGSALTKTNDNSHGIEKTIQQILHLSKTQ